MSEQIEQYTCSHNKILRGEIKIENRENLGQCPNWGEGDEKKTEMSQFQFGNFKNSGGSLYFSKMSELRIHFFFYKNKVYKNVYT